MCRLIIIACTYPEFFKCDNFNDIFSVMTGHKLKSIAVYARITL